jgi:hypothetical protein
MTSFDRINPGSLARECREKSEEIARLKRDLTESRRRSRQWQEEALKLRSEVAELEKCVNSLMQRGMAVLRYVIGDDHRAEYGDEGSVRQALRKLEGEALRCLMAWRRGDGTTLTMTLRVDPTARVAPQ